MTTVTKQLLRAIAKDPSARAEIEQARNLEESVAIAIARGKALGLEVSREEVEKVYAEMTTAPLTDDELEFVVGGKSKDIQGGDGADVLAGGDDDDTLRGGAGGDTLRGGEGNDEMYGDSGNDVLYGEDGDDELYGGSGDDELYGGAGNDKLYSGRGQDTLDGGAGDDELYGGTGDQTLLGGEGDDIIEGQVGEDFIEGGAGDDVLYGLTKGAQGMKDGTDVFVFGTDDGNDIIGDFTPEEDRFIFRGADSIDDIEVVNIGGDTIIQYGETRITVEGVTLSAEEVWNLRYTEEES